MATLADVVPPCTTVPGGLRELLKGASVKGLVHYAAIERRTTRSLLGSRKLQIILLTHTGVYLVGPDDGRIARFIPLSSITPPINVGRSDGGQRRVESVLLHVGGEQDLLVYFLSPQEAKKKGGKTAIVCQKVNVDQTISNAGPVASGNVSSGADGGGEGFVAKLQALYAAVRPRAAPLDAVQATARATEQAACLDVKVAQRTQQQERVSRGLGGSTNDSFHGGSQGSDAGAGVGPSLPRSASDVAGRKASAAEHRKALELRAQQVAEETGDAVLMRSFSTARDGMGLDEIHRELQAAAEEVHNQTPPHEHLAIDDDEEEAGDDEADAERRDPGLATAPPEPVPTADPHLPAAAAGAPEGAQYPSGSAAAGVPAADVAAPQPTGSLPEPDIPLVAGDSNDWGSESTDSLAALVQARAAERELEAAQHATDATGHVHVNPHDGVATHHQPASTAQEAGRAPPIVALSGPPSHRSGSNRSHEPPSRSSRRSSGHGHREVHFDAVTHVVPPPPLPDSDQDRGRADPHATEQHVSTDAFGGEQQAPMTHVDRHAEPDETYAPPPATVGPVHVANTNVTVVPPTALRLAESPQPTPQRHDAKPSATEESHEMRGVDLDAVLDSSGDYASPSDATPAAAVDVVLSDEAKHAVEDPAVATSHRQPTSLTQPSAAAPTNERESVPSHYEQADRAPETPTLDAQRARVLEARAAAAEAEIARLKAEAAASAKIARGADADARVHAEATGAAMDELQALRRQVASLESSLDTVTGQRGELQRDVNEARRQAATAEIAAGRAESEAKDLRLALEDLCSTPASPAPQEAASPVGALASQLQAVQHQLSAEREARAAMVQREVVAATAKYEALLLAQEDSAVAARRSARDAQMALRTAASPTHPQRAEVSVRGEDELLLGRSSAHSLSGHGSPHDRGFSYDHSLAAMVAGDGHVRAGSGPRSGALSGAVDDDDLALLLGSPKVRPPSLGRVSSAHGGAVPGAAPGALDSALMSPLSTSDPLLSSGDFDFHAAHSAERQRHAVYMAQAQPQQQRSALDTALSLSPRSPVRGTQRPLTSAQREAAAVRSAMTAQPQLAPVAVHTHHTGLSTPRSSWSSHSKHTVSPLLSPATASASAAAGAAGPGYGPAGLRASQRAGSPAAGSGSFRQQVLLHQTIYDDV